MQDYLTKRKHFDNRLSKLKENRVKHEKDWKEITEYLAPDCGCFSDPVSEKDKKKDPFYKTNINTMPAFYMKNLAAAMISNLTPSRLRWFKLNVDDETREETIWLEQASRRLYSIFNTASLYEHLYNSFYESANFGPNVIGMQYDTNMVLDFVPTTIGEFYLAEGANGVIDTCYRRFAMTSVQIFEIWGDKTPEKIKLELERDNTVTLHNIIHAIEPNPRYLRKWKSVINKPFISVYYVEDIKEADFLEYKGMTYFPYLVARWDKTGGSVYGNGIGRVILGDVKSLQAYERDLAKASKKKISPPLKGSLNLKNALKDVSADSIIYTDDPNGLSPLFNVVYETREALENINRIMQRIYSLTYNDLFYTLINKDKTMSATEAGAIQQEKLTMLGSVVERLQTEFLKPLVQGAFLIALENGEFPEMPETLIGKELNIKYQSLLSIAQELGDLTNVERFLQFIASAGSINPDAFRKPDMLKIVDFYADRLSIDLNLVKTTGQINKELQHEQALQQQAFEQQQQMEAMQAGAKAAKDYAQAGTIAGNAMDELMQ
jgi:hypothetical protein